MPSIGDAGIRGDTAQLEITMIPGDNFVDGRRSHDTYAFFESVHNKWAVPGSGFKVQGLQSMDTAPNINQNLKTHNTRTSERVYNQIKT